MFFSIKTEPYLKKKYAMLTYGILIIIAALAALLAVKNIKLTSDSVIYALVSQQITSGNGIRVPMIWFESSIAPVNGTIPMLWQPPLLPILLAFLGGVTPQSFFAAQVLNSVCHLTIAIFSFLIMRRLYDNRGIALLTGILVSLSFPMLRITHYIMSETLFIALTAATIYFLTISRQSVRNRYILNLFLASIFAGAGILTRYAGIALIALFFWEAFVSIKNKRTEFKYGAALLSVSIPILTLLLLFAHNYIITGTVRGINFSQIATAPDRSYLSAFAGTIKMLFAQFQLGDRSMMIIIIFTMLFALYFFINANLRREVLKYFHSGLDLIIVYMIVYTALICIQMARESPIFDLRFMSPLVPFLFIISVIGIVIACKIIYQKRGSKLLSGAIILSLGVMALGTGYKTYLNLPEFFSRHEKYHYILNSCTFIWAKEHYGKGSIIATNEPYYLSFLGGYSTIRLPNRRFFSDASIPKDMESSLPRRMLELGAYVLVLFNEVKEDHYGGYLAKLFNNRKDHDSFIMTHKCSDGVVYHLKQ
jgi:hypothetical protein